MVQRSHIILSCAALTIALSTIPAQAQRHHGGGYVAVIPHSPLLWGVGFYSGFYGGFYNPYYLGFGQWYPYPYAYPGPYPNDPAVSVRLLVTPREASVFVDGYAAGVVDDYDGVFQRLRLVPGPHEIVIYHPGHRTLRQNIYYNPGSTHTIRQALDPLAPGEAPEPQPVPRAFPPMPGMPAPPPVEGNRAPESPRLGTLVLRVQPGDASVFVDGEAWRGSPAQDRVVMPLAEGAHRVRVEKAGFQSFAVEVDVRAGETASFNVNLPAQ